MRLRKGERIEWGGATWEIEQVLSMGKFPNQLEPGAELQFLQLTLKAIPAVLKEA